jgi:maltose/moltooligosaccharide transporter
MEGSTAGLRTTKPRMGFRGLWNISFGFFGIQIGFALQNANMSRIFQSLGTSIDDLPALWVAAPLTGLLVQPIIGHMSDKTWLGRLGRRRPYFLAGAIFAALSLFVMPLAPALLFAAVMLWVLDASLNVSMEPFRAFVGDMLGKDQHSAGYAVQTAFIGAGAVVGSIFPWALEQMGVSNVAPGGGIPDTVRYAFWFGGAALLAAVLWTVLTTTEFSPEQMAAFEGARGEEQAHTVRVLAARGLGSSLTWIGAGALVLLAVGQFGLEKEVYLLGGLLVAYGLASLIAIRLARGGASSMLCCIVGDFAGMPDVMKRLALVQFFSWSALFIMWINTTPVVAQNFFGSTDAASPAYQEGANWVGVLFTVYNGVAAIAALTLAAAACAPDRAGSHPYDRAAVRGGRLSQLLLHPRSADAPAERSRRRHRLGVDPGHALCDPRLGAAAEQARHLYGPVQRLRGCAAIAGRDGDGLDHEAILSRRADLDHGLCGRRAGVGRACHAAGERARGHAGGGVAEMMVGSIRPAHPEEPLSLSKRRLEGLDRAALRDGPSPSPSTRLAGRSPQDERQGCDFSLTICA